MSTATVLIGLYSVFVPLLWAAIPRIAQRIDTRLDGRLGLRVGVSGTLDYTLHHDTEGFY